VILQDSSAEGLENKVRDLVDDGYMPASGVSVGGGLFAQAMVSTAAFTGSIKGALSQI
jgi:hypothetical protein